SGFSRTVSGPPEGGHYIQMEDGLKPSRYIARIEPREPNPHSITRLPDYPIRLPPPHHPPDHDDEGGTEQPQRAIQNRLRVHVRFQHQRHAAQPIRQRLFPLQDVAAADLAVGVLVANLAGKMQPEGDKLAAVPPRGSGVL